MSRTTLRRITRLEAARHEHAGRWHQIIIDEREDPEPLMAAMFASGEAQEGDQFMVITIAPPPAPEPA